MNGGTWQGHEGFQGGTLGQVLGVLSREEAKGNRMGRERPGGGWQ